MQGINYGQQFKKKLESRLTEVMKELNPDHELVTTEGEQEKSNFEVAITQFCFKNAPLLKKLKERGDCIKSNDCKGLRKINRDLQHMIDDKHKGEDECHDHNLFKEVHKPHYAFITFMNVQTAELALETKCKI